MADFIQSHHKNQAGIIYTLLKKEAEYVVPYLIISCCVWWDDRAVICYVPIPYYILYLGYMSCISISSA